MTALEHDGTWSVTVGDARVLAHGALDGDMLRVQAGDALHRARVVRDGNEVYLFGTEGAQRFTLHDPVSEADRPWPMPAACWHRCPAASLPRW